MNGRGTEAMPLLRQAVSIRELEFGESHQTTIGSRLRLAIALGSAERWDEALDEAGQVMETNEILLRSTASVTSLEQLFQLLSQDRNALDVFISIASNLTDHHRAALLSYKAFCDARDLPLKRLRPAVCHCSAIAIRSSAQPASPDTHVTTVWNRYHQTL